jgi:arylsulfatase A-like enzyme
MFCSDFQMKGDKMRNQTRRDFLKQCGLITGSASALSLLSSCESHINTSGVAKKPNILYIMTDDHGYQAMSCYGSKINKTPNLDRIANEGMRFNNCFCTNSICGPSRAVILTGKYSHINGIMRNDNAALDPKLTIYPELLQQAGYQTAVVGKWHLNSEAKGFDYWSVLPGQGVYYNPTFIENGQRKQITGYVTDIITDKALDWLKNRNQDKPFCLIYQHKAPHRSWEPNLKYLHLYDDVTIPEPDTLFDDYSGRGQAAHQQDMTIANTLNQRDLKLANPQGLNEEQRKVWEEAYLPENQKFLNANLQGKDLVRWKYQRYIKDYLRCIASVDENVGRVLDYLDQNNLTKDTIVVYTSDQGFYLGEHGWFDKRWMYEESLKMPLLIRYPRVIKAGSVNNKDLVQNLDFAETFLDYAGAPVPDDMQGRSFRKILEGKTPADWRKSVYYHYYEYPAEHSVKRHYGVRTERYKLIHFYNDIDEWELYDLEKDPHEMKSVYNDPKYADIINELKVELIRLRKLYKDDTGAPVEVTS